MSLFIIRPVVAGLEAAERDLLCEGNPESVKYEAMPDKEVQAAVMTRMRQLYPNATVPEPIAFHITRWGQDPLARGCYSAYKPGFDDDDYSTLNKPIKDADDNHRVWLGGEAMCDDLSGSTYGAFQSGRQIAETFLHQTGRGKKPKNICWW